MNKETPQERSERILNTLQTKYPDKKSFDLDGRGKHFVCEVEPTTDHPEYDRAVEVIIKSKPHRHLEMTQQYTVLEGELTLHVGDETLLLKPGQTFTIEPGIVHWAESEGECWAELYSTPGWTQADHIVVDIT